MSRRTRIVLVAIGCLLIVPIAAYAGDRFTDVPESNIFHDDIDWLARAGVTLGCNPPDNDRYCPSDYVTRQQMAAFLRRLAESGWVDAGSLGGLQARDLLDTLDDLETRLAEIEKQIEIPVGHPTAATTGPTNPSLIPATPTGAITTTRDGQVLENFHATSVNVRHNNVALRNFKITRSDRDLWYAIAIQTHLNGSGQQVKGTTIEDGAIITADAQGKPLPAKGTAINGSHLTAQRLDISYMENGIACAECLVEDNYVHDLYEYSGSHNDGFVMTVGSNVVVRHNTILLPDQQTGTVSLFSVNGPIDNIAVENNYLDGGSYTVYARNQGHGNPTNFTVTNNVFGRNYLYGLLSADGPVTWRDNTWADNGRPANLQPVSQLGDPTGT